MKQIYLWRCRPRECCACSTVRPSNRSACTSKLRLCKKRVSDTAISGVVKMFSLQKIVKYTVLTSSANHISFLIRICRYTCTYTYIHTHISRPFTWTRTSSKIHVAKKKETLEVAMQIEFVQLRTDGRSCPRDPPSS